MLQYYDNDLYLLSDLISKIFLRSTYATSQERILRGTIGCLPPETQGLDATASASGEAGERESGHATQKFE